jgi:hypothetical protein
METVAKLSLPKTQPKSKPITYINNKELAIVAACITYFNI